MRVSAINMRLLINRLHRYIIDNRRTSLIINQSTKKFKIDFHVKTKVPSHFRSEIGSWQAAAWRREETTSQ